MYLSGIPQLVKIRDVKKLHKDIENGPIIRDQKANLVKWLQIEKMWLVVVHHIFIALSVNSGTLEGVLRSYLPGKYKFSRKKIDTEICFDASKLVTTIPGTCRFNLGRHILIDI